MTPPTITALEALPAQLRSARRWVLWKYVPGPPGKKPRKQPYYVDGQPRAGRLDSPEDQARLATFDSALAAFQVGPYAGLGFALGPDGSGMAWQGIDLDDIADHPGLQGLADHLPGYVETSPSGKGVHALGYGRPFIALGHNGTGVEAYSAARYFTVTGVACGQGAIVDLADFVEQELAPIHRPVPPSGPPAAPAFRPRTLVQETASARQMEELRSALHHIDPSDYDTWIRVGHALRTLGEQGYDLWQDWSGAFMDQHDPGEAHHKWLTMKPDRTGFRAIFAEAQRRGWINPRSRGPWAGDDNHSHEALARAFAAENAASLRYCAVWNQWLYWDGARWAVDTTLLAVDLARDLCRRVAEDVRSAQQATQLGSASTINAVVSLARADRALATSDDQWDVDRWLLNTPGGVVDLRTGVVSPNDPAHHMTKVTAVAPAQGALDAPIFFAFLERITGGDRDLQAFLQRMCGYMLTGDTSAQALFFAYGTGANGKSVFIDTIAAILGDYHSTAPIETFTEKGGDGHPTELARLRGARLVTAVETEQGRRWAESRIKALTGGDRIAARFMRQDFFEFEPQFKLLVAGNHRPSLRSVDEAMRRRFNMLPFQVTIPPEERDLGLKDKLRAEWGAILAWMIEGCLAWQLIGLAPPAAVQAATGAYLEAEDALGTWLEEACEQGVGLWESVAALYASWKAWALQNGEEPGDARAFAQALAARGFPERRTRQARGRAGLRLRAVSDFAEAA